MNPESLKMHRGLVCAAIAVAVAVFLALPATVTAQATPEVSKTPEVPRTPPVLRTSPVPKTPSVSLPRSPVTEHALRQRRLAKAFDAIDRDGNNLITGAEFVRYYKTSSENTVFIAYDRDRNYVIDRAEFYALSIDGKPLKPEKDGQIDGLRNPLYIHNQSAIIQSR